MLSLPINIFQDIFEVATFFATRLGVSGTEINNCNTTMVDQSLLHFSVVH